MKKIFAVIIAIIIFTAANVFASGYVGNVNSKVFHYSDCTSANKMKFNSRDEAVQTGYRPCKKCKP